MVLDSEEKNKQFTIQLLENQIVGNKKGIGLSIVATAVFVTLTVMGWNLSIAFLILVGFFGMIFGIIACCGCAAQNSKLQKQLADAKSDFEKYKQTQEEEKRHQAIIRQGEKMAEIKREAAQHPQCPMCGSLQTRRITTAKRAASVYAVGLASDKIGKQYECMNCGHKW